MQIFKTSTILVFSLGLFACGGGGGSSDDDDTQTVDARFAEELSFAVTETSKQAAQSQDGGLPSFRSGISPKALLRQHITTFVRARSSSELTANKTENLTQTLIGDCGGSITITSVLTSPDDPNLIYPRSIDSEGVIEDFCTGEAGTDVTFNGTVDFSDSISEDGSSSSSIFIYDISYVANGPQGQFTGVNQSTESCETIGEVETCTYLGSYEAEDGTSYSFANANVSGDNTSGYEISGTITDDDGNDYVVGASGLTLQCDSTNNVSTGTLTITDDDGKVITVTFPNCNECVVTYQGDSNTYPQSED